MEEADVQELIISLSKVLPRFEDGRINYTNADIAPIVIAFVKYSDKVLLLKRSHDVENYRGKWNAVSGFLDVPGPISSKAIDEVCEEIGLSHDDVEGATCGRPYIQTDSDLSKIWITCPALITLKKLPEIKLDFENTEYKWINPEEFGNYDTTPNLPEAYSRCFIS